MVVTEKGLMFSRDQIVSSSQVSKNFGAIRRLASKEPVFVSGRSGIDTVVIGFDAFEALYVELEEYREKQLYEKAALRLGGPAERISLREAMGEDSYADFLSIDPDAVPDEDLFE